MQIFDSYSIYCAVNSTSQRFGVCVFILMYSTLAWMQHKRWSQELGYHQWLCNFIHLRRVIMLSSHKRPVRQMQIGRLSGSPFLDGDYVHVVFVRDHHIESISKMTMFCIRGRPLFGIKIKRIKNTSYDDERVQRSNLTIHRLCHYLFLSLRIWVGVCVCIDANGVFGLSISTQLTTMNASFA